MDLNSIRESLLGKVAWLPRKGLGTFLTIEFGAPILLTREPLPTPDAHPRLARRRVIVQGEQHLWVQASEWLLQSESWVFTSDDDAVVQSQRLEILAGQKLVDLVIRPDGSEFRFEYGESLVIRPDRNPEETLWSIFWHNGGNASLRSNGTIAVET